MVTQAAKHAETVLTQQRYAQLDALLNRAGMYTQFLTEQMQTYAAGGTQEAEAGDDEVEEEPAGVCVCDRRRPHAPCHADQRHPSCRC